MKTTIIVLILVLVLFVATSGITIYKKSKDAQKLTYEFSKASFPDLTIGKLQEVLTGASNEPITLQVNYNVANPTSSTFELEQINLNILTPESHRIIVKQKEALKNPFVIHSKRNNNQLQLTFDLNASALKTLIKENGGLETIAQNRLTSPEWGISILLKGTITTMGFAIDLNEKITF